MVVVVAALKGPVKIYASIDGLPYVLVLRPSHRNDGEGIRQLKMLFGSRDVN